MASTLEGEHRTEVLLYLLRKGPRTKSDIISDLHINSNVLLRTVIPKLEESGLISIKTEIRGIRRVSAHLVGLTIFGKKVAEKIAEVDSIIHEAQKHTKVT